jgi:ATP-dependent helicase HrpB
VSASLPIHAALPELRACLNESPLVLLQAPPGAGKSTALPLALLDEPYLRGRRMLMLEPRRVAARAVAARMAETLGEPVGATVGYQVRFDRNIGPRTRIEVLTEGVLTRMLQTDPSLDGVGLVIFDEFHERSLHADLALALCRDVQSSLREDLRILVMSATLDISISSSPLAVFPLVQSHARSFPVEIVYSERDPSGPLPAQVAAAAARALTEQSGDVLAFLPGVGEIQRARDLLLERGVDADVQALFGEMPLDEQQATLRARPNARRRIVLATAIAETSLTLDGVRSVVDCGFARTARFDPAAGLTRLETTRVTLDSADQRAGRAGRLGPGVCYRLWTAAAHRSLGAARRPEITEADLAPLRLELAQWGVRDPLALAWVTPPPPGALKQAEALLESLDALRDGQITRRGRAMAEWPTHPRLAHLLLESGRDASLAADTAALLDERDPLPRSAGADLCMRIDALQHWRRTGRALHGADPGALARVERISVQWRQRLRVGAANAHVDPFDVGRLVALAYPDRVAQARDDHSGRYRLSAGRGARLADGDALAREPWLAAAHVDAGSDEGRIFLAAPLHVDEIDALAVEQDVLDWDARQGRIVARRERRFGALVVSTKPTRDLPADRKAAVLCDVVRREGLALLPWSDALRQWQARAQCVHLWRGAEWPNMSDEALLTRVDEWLPPWLDSVNRREDFQRVPLHDVLRSQLTHRQNQLLDELAPTHLEVPSGSHVRLSYSPDGSPPVLAVKLQEMFGLADTPTVNDGRMRVLLHLLSPAQRPIQVTQDLRSFWSNTYPIVRRELRGRYIKHPWPEDPWTAPPRRGVKKGESG